MKRRCVCVCETVRNVLLWEWLLDIPGRVVTAARLSEENTHTRIRTPPELTWAGALHSCCPSATEKQPLELEERKVDREGKKGKVAKYGCAARLGPGVPGSGLGALGDCADIGHRPGLELVLLLLGKPKLLLPSGEIPLR